jgi:hypothetical protein
MEVMEVPAARATGHRVATAAEMEVARVDRVARAMAITRETAVDLATNSDPAAAAAAPVSERVPVPVLDLE